MLIQAAAHHKKSAEHPVTPTRVEGATMFNAPATRSNCDQTAGGLLVIW
jgi:hypothetical protein